MGGNEYAIEVNRFLHTGFDGSWVAERIFGL